MVGRRRRWLTPKLTTKPLEEGVQTLSSAAVELCRLSRIRRAALVACVPLACRCNDSCWSLYQGKSGIKT